MKILGGVSLRNMIKALDEGDLKDALADSWSRKQDRTETDSRPSQCMVLDDDASSPVRRSARKAKWTRNGRNSLKLGEMGYDKKKVTEKLSRRSWTEHAPQLEAMGQHEAEETLFRYAIIALG
jgi:hypothetical protein